MFLRFLIEILSVSLYVSKMTKDWSTLRLCLDHLSSLQFEQAGLTIKHLEIKLGGSVRCLVHV